jgi:hypothetical protein
MLKEQYCMIDLRIVSISIISITIIVSANIVIALPGFGGIGIAHGQVTPSLTPEQKAAMCNPSNPKLKVVNMTESKICGLPVTVSKRASTNTTANTTPLENDNTSGSTLPPGVP